MNAEEARKLAKVPDLDMIYKLIEASAKKHEYSIKFPYRLSKKQIKQLKKDGFNIQLGVALIGVGFNGYRISW
jgi:hypothetical protein